MTGRIITIAQQKGGAGKTTVAANLAVAFGRRPGHAVAILDIDPQGSLGEWFEARERWLGEDRTGLDFRTASGWGARREARALARDFDLVLVDTPPHAERESRPAMEAADLVVVPVQPTPVDLWATEPTLSLARGTGASTILVLNRVPPRARLTGEVEAAMQEFSTEIANARLGNRVTFAEAIGRGSSAPECRPSGKAAKEVAALEQELARHLGLEAV